MTEVRRVRMKLGNAEFEADVPEDRVAPMYDSFLRALERCETAPAATRPRSPVNGVVKIAPQPEQAPDAAAPPLFALPDRSDGGMLKRLFDLREDGVVVLKLLPKGSERGAEALLLILYGYRRLKNEDGVLATQLHRAADLSGVSIRWPAYELAAYDRLVTRLGRRKGSFYSLNDEGLAAAAEITTRMLGAILLKEPREMLE